MKNPVNSAMFGFLKIESLEIHTNVLPCPFKSNRKFGYVLVLPSKIYHFLYLVVPVSSLTWDCDAILGRRTICSRYHNISDPAIRSNPWSYHWWQLSRERILIAPRQKECSHWLMSQWRLWRTRDNDECRHINIITSSTTLYNWVRYDTVWLGSLLSREKKWN